MNKKTLRIAEEILKAAEDLIFAAYYEFPAKGNYHKTRQI
jgi:hypothetical protein